MKDTLTVPKDDYLTLYAMKLRLETYFSYLEDNRGVLKDLAPSYLEDAKELINKHNKDHDHHTK
tara:strand:- start:558 stop:749 length:192 start_codon:yes stop_codon:yes gene_type:complete